MARTSATRVGRTAVLAAALVAAGVALVACTPEPEPVPTVTTAPSASAEPTETPAPQLVPGGTASDNLPFFEGIIRSVAAGSAAGSGRAYVDALIGGGFDRGAMQVTRDESTVGNPAESMQVSVRWGEECLIGQVGPATGDPVAAVMPGLADGGCLIGQTRPIDW